MSTDRWSQIEIMLTRLGVSDNRRFRIKEIRSHVTTISSLGTQTMPDFTLHNVTHSDNLIAILDRLKQMRQFTLSEYEAYLLAASAYLHDLGMFFTEGRFQNEILPDIERRLRLCPNDHCDGVNQYSLVGVSIPNQIRLLHHLLSAHWVLNVPPYSLGIEPVDRPYLAIICRGHRGANLNATGCDCYKNTVISGEFSETIRIGLLAGLLRLADALDFYSNRAPAELLESKVYEFLDNPIALEHWLKHYFVKDPHLDFQNDAGNNLLVCQIVVAVPANELVSGKSYLEFMRPLFEKHIVEANKTDLNINQYPASFTTALGLEGLRASLKYETLVGGDRIFPARIATEISSAQAGDILAFLKRYRPNGHSQPSADAPAAETVFSSIRPDSRWPTGVNRILVLAPLFGASNIYYSNLLNGIIHAATKLDYGLSIQPIVDFKQKRALSDYAPLDSLSGLIAITCQVDGSSWLEECRTANLPIVLIHDNIEEAQLENTTVVSYLWPNLEALRDLVRHLVHVHNCRNICVVMTKPHGHRIRKQKLDYICEMVKQEGLTSLDVSDREHLFTVPEYTHKAGQEIAEEILDINPTVDAIMCLADVTAIGLLQTLKEHHRDDVMVTGFDNIDLAEHFQLTSVDQQIKTTGERAVMDLHSALQNRVYALDRPTYIPTTLVVRASCCGPRLSPFKRYNPVQRFAVYYVIEDERILSMIERVRRAIYELPGRLDNTNELIGNAPLFPTHVTIKGIFQLDVDHHVQTFLDDLTKVVKSMKRFRIKVKDVRTYPEKSISLGFDAESEHEMRNLQQRLLPTINSHRLSTVIEPEFRAALKVEADMHGQQNTRDFGEPRIGELFQPHITIVSGVGKDGADRAAIEQHINIRELAGRTLEVNKISVLYETTLGSSWEILKEISLT